MRSFIMKSGRRSCGLAVVSSSALGISRRKIIRTSISIWVRLARSFARIARRYSVSIRAWAHMKLIRGLQNLRRELQGSVVTVGAFDGLHLGHQALLRRLRGHASRLSRPAMMLTFEPTPREFFSRGDPPARLTSLRNAR